MELSLIALGMGFLLDLLLGDPHFLWHPVQGIGFLISTLEKIIRKGTPKTKPGEWIAGGILVFLVLFISAGVPFLILFVAQKIHIGLCLFIESLFCYQILATKSLKVESRKVYDALSKEGLVAGRSAVAMIVGRDTAELTEEGVIKATIETVAENTSDGVIAPLFFMVLGGSVLGFVYKAINTMDSMIGYKNETYLYFGRCAARLDDVVNYIPARISAFLMLLATIPAKYTFLDAWRIFKRDRYNHKSPNSAQTEAVMAGALGIQLAGDAFYFGELYKKPTIGDNKRKVENKDILRAHTLLYWTAIIGVIIMGGLRAVFYVL